MLNYRAEILNSWVQTAPSTRELSGLLGLATPVTLREIVDRIRQIETISVNSPVHTNDSAPINGHVAFELRSNGDFIFSGHMRATGSFSYHYGVQAWATSGDGIIVASQQTGNVFGTDTPGDRQHNWSEAGINPSIKQHWRSLRTGTGIGYNLHAEIGGVLSGALDVLKFAVQGLAANIVVGPYGWVVLIGNKLIGMDKQISSPDILAGILVAGGTLLIVGPFGLVPAIVAGAVAASLLDVRHRAMYTWERDFAYSVFKDKIDYDRIVITNMSKEGGTKFTIPSIGNSILLNMGDEAFDSPITYSGGDYPSPGQVFVHELTHAWQICHNSIVDVICGISHNYDYFEGVSRIDSSPSWAARSWKGFNNEQQAHIVDDWYQDHYDDVNSYGAINDPAFHFIRDNIRAGIN